MKQESIETIRGYFDYYTADKQVLMKQLENPTKFDLAVEIANQFKLYAKKHDTSMFLSFDDDKKKILSINILLDKTVRQSNLDATFQRIMNNRNCELMKYATIHNLGNSRIVFYEQDKKIVLLVLNIIHPMLQVFDLI